MMEEPLTDPERKIWSFKLAGLDGGKQRTTERASLLTHVGKEEAPEKWFGAVGEGELSGQGLIQPI